MDTRLAALTLLYAAHAVGVGSCWLGYGRLIGEDGEARDRLGIPEGDRLVAAIALGYADEIPESPGRRPPQIARWITADEV